MSDVLYRGSAVFFHGKDHIVPSLSVAQFQDNYEFLTSNVMITDKASFIAYTNEQIRIVSLAIRRNYPDLREEDLHVQLDLKTLSLCMRAVQGNSGLQEAAPGEV